MRFYTKLDNSFEKKDIFFLQHYSWNDWWIWETKYKLFYYDNNGNIHDIGTIKIGAIEEKLVKNVSNDHKHPNLPESFSFLTSDFFSIGLSENFYNSLKLFGDIFRQNVLKALNDIAYNPKTYEEKRHLPITQSSLLREISHLSVIGHLRNLANGNATLTEFDFSYRIFSNEFNNNLIELDFKVDPNSFPPSNIHVITGRNGVGKTHLFKNMLTILKKGEVGEKDFGEFVAGEKRKMNEIFSNVISISFSAFDEIEIEDENDRTHSQPSTNGIKHKYIGLKGFIKIEQFLEENKIDAKLDEQKIKEKVIIHKTEEKLAEDFIKSLRRCENLGRYNRWKLILSILESDQLFAENSIKNILASKDIKSEDFYIEAKKIFKRMSSGHSIVLLTITRLIEVIEEKSLILLDEPEGHLHPPLLSAFTRALSTLLRQKNAVAIVSTHSPVVLQEVPKSCVWALRRSGRVHNADRLEIETFGENVGTLTREVFGLEVTNSGFFTILESLSNDYSSIEEILEKYGNQIGMEGQMHLRTLFRQKGDLNG